MTFAAPGFLWALLALAIPVIIHLFSFRRYKRVLFSDIRFLSELKEQTATKNQLKRWLVLLLRMFAFAALILAFAQPKWLGDDTEEVLGVSATSIYVDNTFSMAAEKNKVALLDLAKAAAVSLVQAGDNNDKFQVFTADFEGKHQRLVTKEVAIDYINDIDFSVQTKDLNAVVNRAQSALKTGGAVQSRLFVLSDFQRSIATQVADTSLEVFLLPFTAPTTSNIYIDTCYTISPVQMAGADIQLIYKVQNPTTDPVTDRQVTLKINNIQTAVTTVNVSAESFVFDTLSFIAENTTDINGILEVADFPLQFDNAYHFSISTPEEIRVITIEDGDQSNYFDRLLNNRPLLSYQTINANVTTLDEADFYILNELKTISTELSNQLISAVEVGATVLIVPADDIDFDAYNDLLVALNSTSFTQQLSTDFTVDQFQFDHPLFNSVFERQQSNLLNFSGNLMYQTNQNSSAAVLNVLSTNTDLPVLLSNTFNNGQVFVSTMPLQATFSGFGAHPLFAPLVFNMSVAAFNQPLAYSIGTNSRIDIALPKASNDDVAYHLTKGDLSFIPQQTQVSNRLYFNPAQNIGEAGVYQLNKNKEPAIAQVAFNYDRRESDTEVLNSDELQRQYPAERIKILENNNAKFEADAVLANSGGLWKLCLIFALLFLIAEVLCIRLLS